jgi:hypothetical protein
MITEKEINKLEERQVPIEQINKQLENFKEGFPSLDIQKPALVHDGIIQLSDNETIQKVSKYQNSLEETSIIKFVPASGAATRMFKFLYELYNNYDEQKDDIHEIVKNNEELNHFFSNLKLFPFYNDLKDVLKKHELTPERLIENNKYNTLLHYLLTEDGLNYGFLPKALIKFHQYKTHSRTPLEDHMVEGALYAKYKTGFVDVHFTVLPRHRKLFEDYLNKIIKQYEKKYKVKYTVTFSEQNPATDTIAVNMDNEPFRTEDGELFFRPGGHGALLENLNALNKDIIFIKNIDNIAPDRLKSLMETYKKVLGGVLLDFVQQIHEYLTKLENPRNITDELIDEILAYTKEKLCIIPPEDFDKKDKNMVINYLFKKLNRPVRVGGMVKAHGDTGGGPFWAKNPDGTISLQIAETKQIDMNDPEKKEIYNRATHFNPTDFACYIKDFKGNKFDLNRFVDPNTGFITTKSAGDKEIKAQELPGLWNGAMSEWNTIFVEAPYATFNPVKAINDLLDVEHQT